MMYLELAQTEINAHRFPDYYIPQNLFLYLTYKKQVLF